MKKNIEYFNKNKRLIWLLFIIVILICLITCCRPGNANSSYFKETILELEQATWVEMEKKLSPRIMSLCMHTIATEEFKPALKDTEQEFKDGMYMKCIEYATDHEKHKCGCLRKKLKYDFNENFKNFTLCASVMSQSSGDYQIALTTLMSLQVVAFGQCGLGDVYGRMLQANTQK